MQWLRLAFLALLVAGPLRSESLVGPIRPPISGRLPVNATPVPQTNQQPLSLHDCIRMALEKNLDLAVEKLDPLIARAATLSSLGSYDPFLQGNLQYGETTDPRGSDTVGADQTIRSDNTRYQLTLNQKAPTGTQFSLGSNLNNNENTFNNFHDEYSSFTGGTFVQPLLKNFGTDINLADIRIARKGEAAADAAFRFQVEQTITAVASAYYELIFRRDDLTVFQQSLQLAQRLLDDNRARVDLGTMSPLDVSQANAEVAARREEVLRAERAIRDQENVLKRLITSDVASWLDKEIIPTDHPPDNWNPPSVTSSIATGLENRADYQQALRQAEQQGLRVQFTQNQLLPQLDLRGSYGYAGLGSSMGSTYDRLSSTDAPQWTIGLTFSIPFGNHTERGQLEASKLKQEQLLLSLKNIEQTIIVQVDNAAGQASTNQQRVIAARVARVLAEESLKAEQEKLQAGASTSYTVLQLQRDLTEARSKELRAIADLQQSLAELSRVQGITLKENQITIEEQSSPVLK